MGRRMGYNCWATFLSNLSTLSLESERDVLEPEFESQYSAFALPDSDLKIYESILTLTWALLVHSVIPLNLVARIY